MRYTAILRPRRYCSLKVELNRIEVDIKIYNVSFGTNDRLVIVLDQRVGIIIDRQLSDRKAAECSDAVARLRRQTLHGMSNTCCSC